MPASKSFHVLNGDCLLENLQYVFDKKNTIVWRECLIEGPVLTKNFWANREKFILETYSEWKEIYSRKVISEFQNFLNIDASSDVYFWFEDDVFCQINFWFLLSQIDANKELKLHRVFPIQDEQWNGFSRLKPTDAEVLLKTSKPIKSKDLELGKKLWNAYSEEDFKTLELLAKSENQIFRQLDEVVKAIIKLKSGDLKKELRLIYQPDKSFEENFKIIQYHYGIYGFGDLQIKNLI